ncbi:MAG: hypothetical protein U1F87_12145 [Kiritimatiellia bacterium]
MRGIAQAGFAVNTGDYGAGEIELQARIIDGLGRETVSAPVRLAVLADHDDDGLPDDWELQNFTSLTAQDGDNDPDADGQDNLFEFVAGTQPTNSTSRLTLAITNDVPAAGFSLVFPGRPDRRYTVEHNPSNSLPVAAWAPVPPARFAGTNAVHRWTAPPALQNPPGGWGAFRLSVELP